jgi:hypothetical protein
MEASERLCINDKDLATICDDSYSGGAGLKTFKRLYPDTLRRLIAYARNFVPSMHARMKVEKDATQRDVQSSESVVREIMDFVHEETKGTFKLYDGFVGKLGADEAWRLAREATANVDGKLTTKLPGGEFIRLCKAKVNLLDLENAKRFKDAQEQRYVEWTPRNYQKELAALASQGNSVIVLPTGICLMHTMMRIYVRMQSKDIRRREYVGMQNTYVYIYV